MKQNLQWFLDREMDSVIRIDKDGNEIEKPINNHDDAKYFWKQQDDGFKFKAKVRVHRAPPTGCASCEG